MPLGHDEQIGPLDNDGGGWAGYVLYHPDQLWR